MDEIDKNHHGIGALVHSDILSQIDSVIEGEKPINPCFLYDLGVLSEVICLSDGYTWYFQVETDRFDKRLLPYNAQPTTEELLPINTILAKALMVLPRQR
jgi:hypothetical protein